MALDVDSLGDSALEFTVERHLAALTLVRIDGRAHTSPVGYTFDPAAKLVRVITWSGSLKARLLDRHGPLQASICQVDGPRWLTFEGVATVSADQVRCADAVARYARRYSEPKDRGAERRVIEIAVDRILGRA